jgi:RND family efflux transporter MFP subunit
MATRAGIRTAPASSASASAVLRVPGVVEPNRYKQVAITSLVAGRITQVRGELGQRVNSGQVLATLYSTEFADQQTEYVGLHAELEAHELALTRVQRLASIGAASRQELDMQAAEHARLDAATEAARARLALLGVTDERFRQLETEHTVTTTVDVRAPIAGVIAERDASVGANIDPATPLFTIVDLGTVWVIGDVYERDFQAVRVGSPVIITTSAYPDLALQGKVSYIDPMVQAATRTAKVRVEVPNPGQQLRLGMYVDIAVDRGLTERAVLVPRSAVQTVGATQVVYVASERRPGEFVEREVETVDAGGDRLRVLRGVEAGELVVVEGAFYLRAERERPSSDVPATSHQGH